MATLRVNGHEYYYEDHGPKNAPCIVLSPLFYTDTTVFEPLTRILEDDYRVICYDHRGLGRSAGPTMSNLENSAKDVAAFIEQLNVGPCHFVGNCLGAYVGLQLAIHRSDLSKSCTLMRASAEADSDETIKQMDGYTAKAKKEGMKANVKGFADMWLGSTFKATKDPVQVTRREKWINHVSRMKPEEIDAATQIFHRKDVTKDLPKVRCATLILTGDEDAPANLEAYRRLVKGITGAEYSTVHHAGYALVIEQPEEVAEAVRNFVGKVERQWVRQSKQAPRDINARPM